MTQRETEGLAPVRKPKVLIVVPPPSAGCREAEAFVGALLCSRIREGFELRLALRGTSWQYAAVLPDGVGSLPFEDTPTDGSRFALRRALRRAEKIHREYPFVIVHTFTREDQRVFGAWKRQSGAYVFLIRTWFTPEAIPDTRENRTLYSRTTDINIVLGHETLRRMRNERPNGTLLLDHPCVVGEAPDLSGPAIDNLEHCYLALTAPNRRHPVGGEKADWSHIGLSYVTHFYLDQDSPEAVLGMLRQYERYDPKLLDLLHFVVVDDGSPLRFEIPHFDLNLTWLRVDEDIRWNQSGSRNLGVVYAKSDKVLMTDLDHEFPQERDVETGALRKGHSNTFFLSRARFMRFGGYDEEFSGHYGSEDTRFVKYMKGQGTRFRYFPKRYVCFYRRDIDRSGGYHSLLRDLSFNTPVDSRKKLDMEIHGHEAGHSRMFLNFTWTKVRESRREITFTRPVDRAWKRLWILRWLAGGW
jgi:hypothetical protein